MARGSCPWASACYVSSAFLTSLLIQQPRQWRVGVSPVSWVHQEMEGKKTQGLLVGRDLSRVLSCSFPVTSSPSQLCLPEPKDTAPPARLGAWGTGREVTRGWTWNTPCLTHPATGFPSLPAHVASWPDSYLLSHGHIQTMSPGHTSGPCRVGPGVATAWHWTALECSEGLPSEPAWPSTSPGAPTHILNCALAALSHDCSSSPLPNPESS